MAYRRSISTRATLFARQRFGLSLNYIHHDNDNKHHSVVEDQKVHSFLQRRSFGGGISSCAGFGALIQDQRCSQLFVSPMNASFFSRHMSSTIGEDADKIGYMTDVAEVISDKTVDIVASQAPAVNEVAIAAADSFLPVAALQYLIDGVHSFTGLDW